MSIQAIPTNEKQKEVIAAKPIVRNDGNTTTVSFSVQANGKSYDIWFRTQNLPDGDYSNVALAAALLPAMKMNLPLRLEGAVSPKLLEGVSKIKEVFNTWDESYNPVEIIPETIAPAKIEAERGVASFFSGGVDSFYTLLKNQTEITHIILIHGFDYKPDFPGRTEVVRNIRQIANALGKSLIEIDTNVREFGDDYVNWLFYFGSVLASVALLLSTKFKKIFMPAADSYKSLSPCGSHILFDHLWAVEGLAIFHDGAEATRVKKMSRIVQNDVALSFLRVCWENKEGARNCGKCEKCLRTMLNLFVCGALGKCKTFDRPLDLGRVARIDGSRKSIRSFLMENLEAAKEGNVDKELIQALQGSLDGLYYKGIAGWPRRVANLLKRKGKFYGAFSS